MNDLKLFVLLVVILTCYTSLKICCLSYVHVRIRELDLIRKDPLGLSSGLHRVSPNLSRYDERSSRRFHSIRHLIYLY